MHYEYPNQCLIELRSHYASKNKTFKVLTFQNCQGSSWTVGIVTFTFRTIKMRSMFAQEYAKNCPDFAHDSQSAPHIGSETVVLIVCFIDLRSFTYHFSSSLMYHFLCLAKLCLTVKSMWYPTQWYCLWYYPSSELLFWYDPSSK